jgi:ATP-dependent DNA ligase
MARLTRLTQCETVDPQLAKLVAEASDGPDWLHEIKFDGYRDARPA